MALAVVTGVARASQSYEVGLTRQGQLIDAFEVSAGVADAPTVLLIGSLDGDEESRLSVISQARIYDGRRARHRPIHLFVITGLHLAKETALFPPMGRAYRENPESHALWRWIGIHAPDEVLIAGEDFGLAEALSNNAVAGVGRIPARKVDRRAKFLDVVGRGARHSEAHIERERRLKRTPRAVATELGAVYGHNFAQPTYLPGMALLAQSRLGNVADVAQLAEPYLSGKSEPLGPRATSLNLAGHLVFADLAERTKNERALALVRKAADLGFEGGEMKQSMPFHNEMSDSVFMGTVILTRAGKLTGERRYFRMAARHLDFMNKLVRRTDGLYRHSPLNDAAWGRGNAFAALGYVFALSDWPLDDPDRPRVLHDFQALMAALARHQTGEGLWREVLDYRGAYGETSATAMIGFAMERGIRHGWLAKSFYRHRAEGAWEAVLARTGSDGVLIDVCESTNKQPTLTDYLRREATLGTDERGGGMVMLFATEMAGLD